MIFNRVNLYIIAWSIYNLQGGFFPMGMFFTKVICLIMLLISFYHFIIVNIEFKLPKYFYGLNILIGLFSIYGAFALLDLTNNPLPGEFLKNILISLLPIYSFFFFSQKKLLTEKNISVCIFILFAFAVLNYYGRMYSTALLFDIRDYGMTNNSGYLFIPLIAGSVFLFKKPFLQYFAVSACLLFSIHSTKRGAIFTCFVCLIWYLLNNLRGKGIKIKLGVFLFFAILAFCSYAFFEKNMSESYYFHKKMTELNRGEVSGRNDLYKTFSNYFLNEATPIHFALGSGANATLKISTNYAHNDWLEIAINHGMFGLLIYMFYWILFGRECFFRKYNPTVKLALQIVFIDYFLRTLFSMSYGAMTTSATLILGYCLAQGEKNEKDIQIVQTLQQR